MTDNIIVTYQWTKPLFNEAMRQHFHFSTNKVAKYLAYVVSALFFLFSIMNFNTTNIFPSLFFLFGGIYITFLRPIIRFRVATRQFNKNPDSNAEVKWIFSEDYLTSEINHQYHTEMPWQSIKKVYATKNGFLLYSETGFFYFIPHKALSNDDYEKLEQLLKNKISNYIEAEL